MSNSARRIVPAFVALALLAGALFFWRNFQKPEGGRAANVADAPAGGRTQAMPDDSIHAGMGSAEAPAIEAPGDPLEPGIPEAPDIPANSAHAGIKKVGVRIKEAVLADGVVGDRETPNIDMTGLTAKQRVWLLDHALALTCTCGCGQDLLECRRDDAACPISPRLTDSLLVEARRH